jgi:hypothetical protein
LLDDTIDIREYAANALRAIGPAAIPALEGAFPKADAGLKARMNKIADGLGRNGQQIGPYNYEGLKNGERILECWVLIYEICDRTGIKSLQGAAKEMVCMKSRRELDERLFTKYTTIRSYMD